MPSPGRVELEAVVTKVEQALARLKSIETAVKQLQSIASSSPANITVQVDQALARIEEVRAKLSAFRAEASGTGAIVLRADATQLLSAVQQAERGVTAALDRIKAKAKEADPLDALARQASRSAASVNTELDKLDKSVDRTFAALKKRAAENVFAGIGENASKEAAKLNAEFQKLERNFAAAVARLQTESRRANFDPASASARKLREDVRLAAEDIVAFAARVQTSTVQAGGNFQQLGVAAKNAQNAIAAFPPEAGRASVTLGELGASLTNVTSLLRLFLASLIVQQIKAFTEASVEAAVKLELLKTALRGLLGGADEADQALAFLRKTADDFGLSFIELTERFRSFAPAAKEAGLSAQQIEDVFRSVAVASRALGFTTEETQRALLAFQQILQKGKFQGEELTKQLGQLLPNALAIMARETGKSSAELLAMMKQGRLTSDAILALGAGLTDAFGPTAVGNARATAAEIERFKNALFDAKVQVGNELLPALRDLLRSLQAVGTDGTNALSKIGAVLSVIIEGISTTVGAVQNLTGGLKAAALEFLAQINSVVGNIVGLFEKLSGVSEAFGTTLSRTLFDQADGLRALAAEARGAADEFKDSWVNAGKTVADENDASTARMREAYKKTQEEAAKNAEETTKKELSEQRKREEGLLASLRRMQKASKDLAPSFVTPTATGGNPFSASTRGATEYQRSVEQLRQELARLQAEEQKIRDSTLISPEESNRADELRQSIRDVETQLHDLEAAAPAAEAVGAGLASAGTAAAKAATEVAKGKDQIVAALDEMITHNEGFQESFKGLSGPAQAAVIAIVDQFEQLNASVGVTDADVAAFGAQLAAVFAQGGVVSREFAAQLKADLAGVEGTLGGAAEALRRYAQASQEAATPVDHLAEAQRRQTAAASPLTQTTAELDVATGRYVIATRESVDAIASHGTALQGLATLFDQQPGHILTATEAQLRFGLTLEEAQGILRQAGVDVAEFHGGLAVIESAANAAGGSITTASGKVFEIGEKGKEAGKGLDEAGGKLDTLGQKTLPPGPAESVGVLAKASHEASTGLQATGIAAEGAKGPLEAVGTAAEKIGKATVPPGLAEGLVGIGAAAAAAQGPLAAAAGSVEKIGAGLAEVAKVDPGAITKIGEAFSAAAGPLAAAATPAGVLSTALSEIAGSLGEIAGQAGPFAEALNSAGTALQTLADSGAASTLSGQFDSLHSSVSSVAGDFDQLAKGAQTFSDQAGPVGEAVTSMSTAFGKLDLSAPNREFATLNETIGKLGSGLSTAATNQSTLNTNIRAGGTAIEDLKGKMEALVAEVKGALHAAIATTAVGDFGTFKEAATKAKEALGDLLKECGKLDTEATPAINRAAGAVATLASNLREAAAAARDLNSELSKASLG